MKMNHILYQLLLGITWKKLAIATSLLLVIPLAPTKAQFKTPQTTPIKTPQTTPNTNTNTNAPSGQNLTTPFEETDYTLGAGDQIRLDIFQVEEYSGEYPVNVDGTISLPLVGGVNVEGLTLKETEEVVSKQYSTYLKRPIVNAGLVAPRPLEIGISGEVDNPGSYEFQLTATTPDFPTVTDIIEQAGGITTLADVRNVQVQRVVQGRTVTFQSDLWSLLNFGQLNQDISLRDGDTVFLPTVTEINTSELKRLSEASFGLQIDEPISVAVVGEIYRPGSLVVQPEKLGGGDGNNNRGGQARDSLPPRLTQAITLAGGITTLADVRNVQIRRVVKGRTTNFTADLWSLLNFGQLSQDISLRDGDTIFLPTVDAINPSELERLSEASFGLQVDEPISVAVVGEIFRPGSLVVQPEQLGGGDGTNGQGGQRRDSLPPRLTQAIQLAGGIKPTADVRTIEIRRETWDGKEKLMTINLWELFKSADADKDIILQEGDEIIIPQAVALSEAELQEQAEFTISRDTITVNVVGEVVNPGAVQVKPNTPLNQAILAAGGFDKSRANQGEVELVRLNLDGTVNKREIEVDLASGVDEETNPILKENDVVVVGRGALAATGDAFRPAAAPLGILRLIFGF